MGITVKNNKPVTKNMTIKGDDGVGIKTIISGTPVITEEKTTTPITVTLTDETTQNFNVEAQNGSGDGTGTKKYFHQILLAYWDQNLYIGLVVISEIAKFTSAASLKPIMPVEMYYVCSTGSAEGTLTKLPMSANYRRNDERFLIRMLDLTTHEISTLPLSLEQLDVARDDVVEL